MNWEPNNWDMIGHDWAVKLLQSHISVDRVRHAYLFTGPTGIGKRTLAIRFAQTINCSNPPATAEYCGECRACTLIWEGTYPDIHLVSAEEQERTLKVDQIRGLQRKVSLSPYEGKYHVALLLDFHRATEQAGNALLKTLEEPPPQVIMLLTAESTDSLLPTIVSRCEVVPLRLLSLPQLEKELEIRFGDHERAELIAGLSAGRPGYALRLAEDQSRLEIRDVRMEELISVLSSDRIARFDFVETWDRSLRRKFDKLDQRRLESIAVLELWLGFWRDVLLTGLGAKDPESNPDRQSEIRQVASEISTDEIVNALRSIEQSIEAIHRNANLRLALETLMLDLPSMRIGLD
jgi:DNA polymerase-3 subunit delta'